MPPSPLKPCRKIGCNELSKNTYCEKHAKKREKDLKETRRNYDKVRGTRSERGYTNEWVRYSKQYRLQNPLCVECEKEGVVAIAQCVDHIVPHKGDQELFWNVNNHQGLCNRHHSIKTATEDGGYGNR